MAGVHRRLHFCCARWFDADDEHIGPRLFDRGRDAGDQASTADGHEHRGYVRSLLEDLEASGALTGDDPLVIERRNHGESARGRFGFGSRASLGRGRARKNHFRAKRTRTVDLDLRRRRGHDDDRGRSERAGGERHRLAVVARRVRDDAGSTLGGIELRDHVVRAADLERARWLKALALEEEWSSRRTRHVDERRDARDRSDARGRGANLVQGHECSGRGIYGHGVCFPVGRMHI